MNVYCMPGIVLAAGVSNKGYSLSLTSLWFAEGDQETCGDSLSWLGLLSQNTRRGGFNVIEICFSQFWKPRNPRSRC